MAACPMARILRPRLPRLIAVTDLEAVHPMAARLEGPAWSWAGTEFGAGAGSDLVLGEVGFGSEPSRWMGIAASGRMFFASVVD